MNIAKINEKLRFKVNKNLRFSRNTSDDAHEPVCECTYVGTL